jgi:hypothetical protein
MFSEIALRDPRSGRILPISTNHALDNSDIFPALGTEEDADVGEEFHILCNLWAN